MDSHISNDPNNPINWNGKEPELCERCHNELTESEAEEVVYKYKVLRKYSYGWDNGFFSDDNGEAPTLFCSKKEAENDIKEHIKDIKSAIKLGNMGKDSLEAREDFKIVPSAGRQCDECNEEEEAEEGEKRQELENQFLKFPELEEDEKIKINLKAQRETLNKIFDSFSIATLKNIK